MKFESLGEFFTAHDDEYLQFAKVQNKLSNRPDLHAFLLLDQLVPGDGDIVCGASHDEICLGVDEEKLWEVATPEQLIALIRCGVRHDGDGLCMFA